MDETYDNTNSENRTSFIKSIPKKIIHIQKTHFAILFGIVYGAKPIDPKIKCCNEMDNKTVIITSSIKFIT